jgi:predicted histidine transporter YuiF (NhaC family)
MFIGQAVKWNKIDEQFEGGVKIMGLIAIIMLVAGGYADVMKATNSVDALVQAAVSIMGGNKIIAATVITLIGLLVTMGIGSSFSTVPVVAIIYVPLCSAMGFSTAATAILMSAAAALGDAGSPASDTTLGPTSGLNADGQHDHIWDTCVPTFIHYNIPLMIGAIVISQFI